MRKFLRLLASWGITLTLLLGGCADGSGDIYDYDGDGTIDLEDCDSEDPLIYPGAPDPWGDHIDQDCDGGDGVDADGDGYPAPGPGTEDGVEDCDDSDAGVHPGAQEVPGDEVDEDCDGVLFIDADGDHTPADEDCDDSDPALNANDADGDGDTTCGGDCDDSDPLVDGVDRDGDGLSTCAGDCDDLHETVYPGAPELCDGLNNSCADEPAASDTDFDLDGATPCQGDCDDTNALIHPNDEDGDGSTLCDPVPDCDDSDASLTPDDLDHDGSSSCDGDCDDGDAARYPGAAELCDGLDNDCDDEVPADEMDFDEDGALACADCDDTDPTAAGLDTDGDGFSPCDGDCNEGSASTYPGAFDSHGDGIDQNCDGGDGVDGDGDGYPSNIAPSDPLFDCDDSDPLRYPADGDADGFTACDDCDDSDPEIHPGAADVACDGVDSDCLPDADESDGDGDGYSSCGGDCDDDDATSAPGLSEVCDGADNDCDGALPADEADGDGDGQLPCSGDCDDTAPTVYAGAPELCDQIDNNCDTVIDDPGDRDADGYVPCSGDCDDTNADAWPGAPDPWGDGVDTNCDGSDGVDADGDGSASNATPGLPGYDCDDTDPSLGGLDGDGDGVSACDGDCDDADPARAPGLTEVCDGVDTDCDGAPLGTVEEPPSWSNSADSTSNLRGNVFSPSADVVLTGLEAYLDAPAGTSFDWMVYELDGPWVANAALTLVASSSNESLAGGAQWHSSPVMVLTLDPAKTYGVAVQWNGTAQVTYHFGLNGPVDTASGTFQQGILESHSGSIPPTLTPAGGLSLYMVGLITGGEGDIDGDGHLTCADCADADATIYPGAPELCDGLDNDCNGFADFVTSGVDSEPDADADGSPVCLDCDDTDPVLGFLSPELCDGLDNDCDGLANADADGERDIDGDGHLSCLDCDEGDVTIHPGAAELCDDIDSDCDGLADGQDVDVWPSLSGVAGLSYAFEHDGGGWTVEAEGGSVDLWEWGTPTSGPGSAHGGSGAWATNLGGDYGVDSNTTRLISPAFTVPGGVDLSFWYWQDNEQDCHFDFTEVKLRLASGTMESVDDGDSCADGLADTGGDWVELVVDVSAWAGQIVELVFEHRTDGSVHNFPGVYIDDVVLGVSADLDGDSWANGCGDCDDADPTVHTDADELCDGLDNDCDGFADFVTPDVDSEPDADGDGDPVCRDCDDADPDLNTADTDGDGVSSCDSDCDDAEASILPGADELCDGLDNDCNGFADFHHPGVEAEQDADGDGFVACVDCDDNSASTYPGAGEVCDDVDTDCDDLADGQDPDVWLSLPAPGALTYDFEADDGGWVVEAEAGSEALWAWGTPSWGATAAHGGDRGWGTVLDGDYGATSNTTRLLSPLVAVAGGGELGFWYWQDNENDCRFDFTQIKVQLASGELEPVPDGDGCADGLEDTGGVWVERTLDLSAWAGQVVRVAFEHRTDSSQSAFPGVYIDDVRLARSPDRDADGWAGACGDCDDTRADVSPDGVEVCDTLDNDCNGFADFGRPGVENEHDGDGDGDAACADCDDADPSRDSLDRDGDGVTTCDGDCDDDAATALPGGVEVCDGLDNDCNGSPDFDALGEADNDGDGQHTCDDDCDDNDPLRSASFPEVCDGVDNDCDGVADFGADGVPSEGDADSDGSFECADCDDADAVNRPGGTEICDGRDNDCDGEPGQRFEVPEPTGSTASYVDEWYGHAGVVVTVDSPRILDSFEVFAREGGEFRHFRVYGGDTAAGPFQLLFDASTAEPADTDYAWRSSGRAQLALLPGASYLVVSSWSHDGYIAVHDDLTAPFTDDGVQIVASSRGGYDLLWDDTVFIESDPADALPVVRLRLAAEGDSDGDGLAPCAGDCDDTDVVVQGDDSDGDGFSSCEGDCDDADPDIRPGAPELCDGVDSDCIPSGVELDRDGDGWMPCAGDCDDDDIALSGADGDGDGLSSCDDCDDSAASLNEDDADGDDWSTCAGDCDDADATRNPGVPWEDPADGFDADCDGNDAAGLGQADLVLGGVDYGDRFGRSAAVADFDGDGRLDLVVGAPLGDESGTSSGEAAFFSGATLDTLSERSAGASDADIGGAHYYDGLATAMVALPDLDGDGLPEVAVSAPGADGEVGSAGVVYILGGSQLLGGGVVSVDDARRTLEGTSGQSDTGASLARVPDIDGDGVDELAIGAPRYGSNEGRVYLVTGQQLAGAGALDLDAATWSVECSEADAACGTSLAAGDLDGDGLGDLVIGAPGAQAGKGAVAIVFGGDLPPSGALGWSSFPRLVGDADEGLGASLAVLADLDGDGTGELAVGSPGAALGGTARGRALVLSGATLGVGYTWEPADAEAELTLPGVDNARVGASLAAAGDVDGDGLGDLLVGIPGYGSGRGAAALLLGGSLWGSPSWDLDEADTLFVGVSSGDGAGVFVGSVGDFNGDGRDDLLVGSEWGELDDPSTGSLHVLFSPW